MQICQIIPSDVLDYKEVTDFFIKTLCPIITQLHSASGTVILDVLNIIISAVESMPIHKVK